VTAEAPVCSVVVPAYNEATGIARMLDHLYADGHARHADVVVVCNGCTDGTADRARATGHPVRVIELDQAGKPGAIRAGEAAAPALPRLYLDADIVTSGAAVVAVASALANGAVAARAPARFDLTGCSWVVRRFFAASGRLPGVQAELCGGGMYGLSAEARSRFGEFPDLVADDLFVARIVSPSEVTIVDTTPTVLSPPRTLAALWKVRRRVVRGTREMSATQGADSTAGATGRELLAQLKHPRHVVDVVVYASIVMGARLAVRLRRSTPRWERDDTSRTAA
jgi:glycosyltransferase involved in cell wall biosynthesis